MSPTSKRHRRTYANGVYSNKEWLTVVETAPFQSRAQDRLTEDEVEAVISLLAKDPTKGDVIRSTGGVRKLRVATKGRGKSGGARVIYYYYNQTIPLFLLTVFSKSERSDLTQAERSTLSKVVESIRKNYGVGT